MSTAAPLAPAGALAPSALMPPPAPADLRTRLRTAPTPSRLKAFMYGVWAIAALLFVFGAFELNGARAAIRTVGKDTAPSIMYAQEISSWLADLDANAGNYLLGSKQHQAAAAQTFEQRRTAVTARLVDAAHNITYGDSEKVPINALFDGLGRYLELCAEMRYLKDSGDTARALDRYSAATDLMHQRMLPAAAELDTANSARLKSDYDTQVQRSGGAEIVVAFIAAGLFGLLLWAQVFLVRRTRRIFNPALVVATVVAAVFGVYLVTHIATAREDLRIAKEDAFESIHALWQARAVAYDANGDETRYLLFPPVRAAAFEQAYRDKVKKLATIPQPDEAMLVKTEVPASYKGFFAAEMRNVTFDGERAAAQAMIRTFAAYDVVDVAIRQLERGGRHAEAVEKCIGAGARDSNAAFAAFDRALKVVIDINHKQFDATVDRGESALVVAGVVLPVAALLIAFLTLFGIRPRLREYAA